MLFPTVQTCVVLGGVSTLFWLQVRGAPPIWSTTGHWFKSLVTVEVKHREKVNQSGFH
jgi:hypothetical protein